MPLVFLPGPFADPAVLSAALGGTAPGLRPAAVAGFRFALGLDPLRAALVAAEGAQVAGGLAALEAAGALLVGRILGALAPAVAPAAVVTTDGALATAFVSKGGGEHAAAEAAPLDAEGKDWLAEAVREIAALAEDRPAEALGALLPGVGYRALGRARAAGDAAPVRARAGFAAAGDVESVAVRRPYARYFLVEEHRLRHRRFDGRMSGEIDRAVFCSGDAVTVLPFDPRTGRVLLVEQFRAGPHARRDPHPWSLEAVAGRCDPGEDAEATARREALEEAGVRLGRLARVASYYPSPGLLSEHITSFVGEGDLAAAGGVHGLASEDEDIRALVLPLGEAMDLVALGEINCGPLLVTLLWLDREAGRLAADWR